MVQDTIIKNPRQLFIGGRWTAPRSTATIQVLNSSTEEVFEVVAEAGEDDIAAAVAAAHRAFHEGPWPLMTHVERAGYIRAIAAELDRLADRHATIWAAESGILHSIAKPRMRDLGADYTYYADLADSFPFEERHASQSGGSLALLVREPVGVVAVIVPWNSASGLAAKKIAPALLAGCTAVVKASPEAPGAAYILAEACENAGLPPGVLNFVVADRAASEALVRHPQVDKVAFTGSTAAGRRIAAACGERVARCTLELGGKSPAVVLDDYDIDKAARAISGRAVFLTGQVCLSLTRVIVTRSRHDAMVEALSAQFAQVKVGSAFDLASEMGPLAMKRQRDSVERYIAAGKAEGATLATGGGRPAHLDKGFFIEPTVFGNVANDSTIGREEIFGPVLSVIPADDEAHAVAIANDTIFGLNASVFTNDVERAYAVARGIRAGTVGQNALRNEPRIAFGGFKQSGMGREGGREGLMPYLETKVVVLDGASERFAPFQA